MLPEADVDVPLFVVCQYQISPPDGVPVLVRVTPGDAHCGELLVGFAGAVGNEYTVNVPALVAVATAVGALRPGRAILWGFATIALQPVALLLMSEPSPLMAVGLIFFSVFALICALGAFIGGLLRISIARLLGKAKNGAPV